MPARSRVPRLLLLLWLAILPARAGAAEVQDALLNLVGAEAGLVVEIAEGNKQFERFRDSELWRRIEQSPLYAEWQASEGARKLSELGPAIEKLTGKPLGRQLSELFGESVVLAVYAQQQEAPAGVLLTRTASSDVLKKAIADWNRADPRQVTTSVQYGQQTYFRRERQPEGGPSETLYYVALGRVLALSDREEMIRQVIERASPARGKSGPRAARQVGAELAVLPDSPDYLRARSSVSGDPALLVYLNPRAWDALLETPGPDGTSTFPIAVWKQIGPSIVTLKLENGVVAEFVLHSAAENRAGPWAAFLVPADSAQPPFAQAPADAPIIASGRWDFPRLGRLLVELASAGDRAKFDTFRQVSRGWLFGLDPFDDVLPQLGPDWHAWAMPRAEGSAGPPFDVVLSVALAGPEIGNGVRPPGVRPALDNSLATLLNLASAAHNSKAPERPAIVRLEPLDDATLRWIDGLGDFNPGYALTSDQLVFSSSIELLRQSLSRSRGDDRRVASGELLELAGDADQTVYADLRAVRKHLAAPGTESETASSTTGEQHWLTSALTLFDSALFAVRTRPDQLRLMLRAGTDRDKAPVPE